ncbi:hypothetical protein PANO111632_02640 [Paracoccus nototheniae]|uniref:PhiE125 gp8 family phage protein n=1 Tax=Paracoccus nototheniae TaxID=2489002 RepID=A0ABW4DXK8_9RHOB|nr:hypothetical protein [Paracoccus nototheniae]
MWYPVSDEITLEAVDLEDARFQLRLSDGEDDFDANVFMLVKSARAHVEAYCSRAFAAHSMVWACDGFGDLCRLPMGPASSIASIGYTDPDAVAQTVPGTVYQFRADGLEPSIALRPGQRWPSIQPGTRITVTGTFGGQCPDDVKHAMLLLIEEGFDPLENKTLPIMSRVDALLANHRRGCW